MPYFILAVLLTVMQTAPAVPRQAPNDSAGTGSKVQSQTKPKNTPAQSAAPAVDTGQSSTLRTDAEQAQKHDAARNGQRNENTDHSVIVSKLPTVTVASPKRDLADWGYWAFSGLLVVVGGFQAWLLWWTLRQIRGQRKLMGHQWRTMSKQLKEMAAQTNLLNAYVGHTKTAADAAKASADAAKISADVAAGVSVPTLVVEKFEVGETGTANLAAFLQYPQIRIAVKNCGQTPAFLKWWTIIFTCEDLPDIPVYNGKPGCGIVLGKIIVEPNASYTLPNLSFPHRQELAVEDVQAIIDCQKILNAYGYICYGDLFGNPTRRLKFCETALNFGDGWIDWRSELAPDAYVGTDRLPSKKRHDHPEEAN